MNPRIFVNPIPLSIEAQPDLPVRRPHPATLTRRDLQRIVAQMVD